MQWNMAFKSGPYMVQQAPQTLGRSKMKPWKAGKAGPSSLPDSVWGQSSDTPTTQHFFGLLPLLHLISPTEKVYNNSTPISLLLKSVSFPQNKKINHKPTLKRPFSDANNSPILDREMKQRSCPGYSRH